jgi:hypothetical protein
MEDRYNVYFAGQVIDGHDLHSVRDKLAKVFNADQATLDKLFSGKPQLIKRNCDAATAQKYREAMERAGAIPLVQLADSESTTTIATNTPARPLTAAEKIAALAAAPDTNLYGSAGAGAVSQAVHQEASLEPGGIVLAPPGTEVLREEERAAPVTRDVDTSGLAVDMAAKRLSEESPPPPAAPDTHHLSMADVGDTIPNLPAFEALLSPDITDLTLAAPGTDFSDCTAPEPQTLELDLSALAILPTGAVLLEEQFRKQEQGTAPFTEHISLKD